MLCEAYHKVYEVCYIAIAHAYDTVRLFMVEQGVQRYTCNTHARGEPVQEGYTCTLGYTVFLFAAYLLERDLGLSVDIGERYESFPTILGLVRKNPPIIPSSHHSLAAKMGAALPCFDTHAHTTKIYGDLR